MSYLSALRLHFAGEFQAAVSTVNNDSTHFDNGTFDSSFQDMQGPNGNPPNGWWNPHGDGDWRVIGCKVTAATGADGEPVDDHDPILGALIADSDRAAPAKLVDLDPMQQMVSTIWGLELRICDATGTTLVRGTFEPAGFFDIWDRARRGGGDINACAMYQSILTGVQWSDVTGSPFLTALRGAQQGDLLSVKFMVDGYDMTATSPTFTLGRIVGSIGPAAPSEPAQMVRGRQLMAAARPGANFFAPAGKINFCTAVLDVSTSRVLLDLGNALPTDTPGGPISQIGAITLFAGADELCPVPYGGADFYERTAGIVALPADRALTAAEVVLVQANPLSLHVAGQQLPAVVEAPLYVRPDQFVLRLNPGESHTVSLVATKLGAPLQNASIVCVRDPSQLQPTGQGRPFGVADPPEAIRFPAAVTTGPTGVATLTITAQAPGQPRDYIDGQVYGIRAAVEQTMMHGLRPRIDPRNVISVLVWDTFRADDPPTWLGSLEPVFVQYANLYPIMQAFLDLSSYDSVCENQELLLLAFGLDPRDPNSMPVTRDLSASKRTSILSWLGNRDAEGKLVKPLLGTSPPPSPADGQELLAAVPVPVPTPTPGDDGAHALGGKAAAASRQLVRPD